MKGDDLKGRVALVTGGAVRVGSELCRVLAASGAAVVVHYNSSAEAAARTVAEIEGAGGVAAALRADLAEPGQVSELFAAARDALGPVDILVNNAAVFELASFEDLDLAKWERALKVNLTAPFLCCKEAAPMMREASRGDIVNVCDIGGMVAWKGFSHYNVSKAGLIMLTRSLAVELAPEIRVNAVAPGTVLFPDGYDEKARRRIESRIPMGRAGSPRDVAEAVLFLIAGPRYITGQVLAVNGGRSARDVTGG